MCLLGRRTSLSDMLDRRAWAFDLHLDFCQYIFPCRIRESFHITAWTQVDHVLPACLFRYYFFSLSRGTCFFAEIQFCKSPNDWPCRARTGGVGVHRKTPRLPGQPWLPIPDPFPLSPHRPVFLNNLELQFAK